MVNFFDKYSSALRNGWDRIRATNEFVVADGVRYIGFWPGFKPENFLLHKFLCKYRRKSSLRVVGPRQFLSKHQYNILRFRAAIRLKADYFITGENREPAFDIAVKQIGFWNSYSGNDRVLRFPNWMWHLDWPGIENQPYYERYGMRLTIDRLLHPLNTFYDIDNLGGRLHKAVMFSTHLREPRGRLFDLVNRTMGCDGFGMAFNSHNLSSPKMPILEKYSFCLCPENSLGDGYITEKIPEAFHAGCIPITWCRPEDLAIDFNQEAVVNLFGLSDDQIAEVLFRLLRDTQFVSYLRSVPLLKNTPSLMPLYEFLRGQAGSHLKI